MLIQKITTSLLVTALTVIYVLLAINVQRLPRGKIIEEMQIALPRPIQIGLAFGDSNLAANFAALRALVANNFNMNAAQFAVLARVQEDVSAFNPAHEDNYYIATAILPWEGQLKSSQIILQRARISRPYDYQPALYEAINTYHFMKDAATASNILITASSQITDANNQIAMLNLAARWSEKGYTPDTAEKIVIAMAKQSNNPEFKKYLLIRASRLKTLQKLQHAALTYSVKNKLKAKSFNDLLQSGLIESLPNDPFGFGYIIDHNGVPQLLNKKSPS